MNADRLRELRDGIHPGQPLDELQWLNLDGILELILEGFDVRESYGIKPKRGRRPQTRGRQKWRAVHYWALRDTEPQLRDTEARDAVAQLWGVQPERAYKDALAHKTVAKNVLRTMTRANVLELVQTLQQFEAPPK